ncbi:MAG: hypothetical protein JWO40_687 [Candidatus Doudnabacteria bacterium]|nr:hypothetical protein [Candidatus Doudnabacteria bacterium]
MNENRENQREIGTNPFWVRPNPEKEQGEIQRAVQEFLKVQPSGEVLQQVIDQINISPIVDLADDTWSLLENTDSYDIRPGFLEDAENLTEEYNSQLSVENKRNFKALVQGFKRNQPMEVPIIIKSNDRLHLLSGNTRLMISRALSIKPKVIIAELP